MKKRRNAASAFSAMLLACLIALMFGSQATCLGQSAPAPSPDNTGSGVWSLVTRGGPQGPMLRDAGLNAPDSLQVHGYMSNTTAMWFNPSGITTNGKNSGNYLAAERNLLQLDMNYRPTEHNEFFVRGWGVYEPAYSFEEAPSSGALFNIHSQGNTAAASSLYNQLNFREAWWRTEKGPVQLFLGRQIVTWGESLAFRVGDVINPQDLSWNFGFANLEQSRIPLWMVHPIVNLPDIGPLSSTFIEGVWAPAFQPACSEGYGVGENSQYPDERYRDRCSSADTVNRLPPFGGRFEGQINGLLYGPSGDFPQVPITAFARPTKDLPYLFDWRIPADTWANSEEGVRFHTLLYDTEVTALYWHGHQYFPTTKNVVPFPNFLANPKAHASDLIFPQLNDIGITANRPVYLPGEIGSRLPLVVRAEAVWQDQTPFQTRNPTVLTAVQNSSTINTLLALDLEQAYVPWLTQTGTLSANLEWNNYTILSPSRYFAYPLTTLQQRHNEENLLLSVSSNWYWNAINAAWINIYNPDGNTFLMFPNVTLTPPWTNKYLMKIGVVDIQSNNKYDALAGGQFKGKNFIYATFQYNFNLL